MGKARVYICKECGEEINFTTDGITMLGAYRIYHYQCPTCRHYQETWVTKKEGKVETPKKVICEECGSLTKRVSYKKLLCPKCGSSELIEDNMIFLD